MHWLYFILLALILLCGLLLNVMTLPGNWLILLSTFLYGWITKWNYVGWKWLLALLIIASVAELIEFLSAGKAATKAGGSRLGAIGAVVGGLVGAILLTGIIPVPIVGTLAGVLIGTFIGAAVVELAVGKEVGKSMLIGFGATRGRLYGTILKIVFGFIMMILALAAALPL